MNQRASNNCASNVQSQFSSNQKNPPVKIRRRLEHLADLQEGVDRFDMVPRCLTRAFLENRFTEAKYKLLLTMLSHGENFSPKRNYLEQYFAKKSLAKYLPELISEGYIECESLPCKTGGVMNIYHVRPITDWLVYRQTVDRFLGDGRLGEDLKDTKYPSIDPAPVSGTPNETDPKEEEKPSCQNDDVFNSTYLGGKKGVVRGKTSSREGGNNSSPNEAKPSGEAVRYALRMEFLYSKKKGGTYDWKTANGEAEIFLREFGEDSAMLLRRWADDNREIHGRVKVKEGMFHWLWDQFENSLK